MIISKVHLKFPQLYRPWMCCSTFTLKIDKTSWSVSILYADLLFLTAWLKRLYDEMPHIWCHVGCDYRPSLRHLHPFVKDALDSWLMLSLTSMGSESKRWSSTIRQLLRRRQHWPSWAGRRSRQFPFSSRCASCDSWPIFSGMKEIQLWPRHNVLSLVHLNSCLGTTSTLLPVMAKCWRFCRKPTSSGITTMELWLTSRYLSFRRVNNEEGRDSSLLCER